MRSRFHYSGINIPELAENSPQAKFEAAWKGLTNGSLTPQEYNQTVNGVMAELKAKELELQQKALEANKPKDITEAVDEGLKLRMLGRDGKAKVVEENGKQKVVMVGDENGTKQSD